MSHPARFSPQIIDRFAEILLGRWPDWFGRPLLFDPWGGTFERIAELCERTGFYYDGVEIEPEFIVAPGGRQGDSTQWESYPPARFPVEYGSGRWVVCTSPPYPNGMCLAQEHRILTRDLRWVPAGDLQEGDELLTFDESTGTKANGHSRRRHFQWGEVVSSAPATVECVRVILADGTEVICTPDHPWLADRYSYGGAAARFVESRNLMGTTDIPRGRAGHHGPVWVKRQFDPWATLRSYDAGWLAGMFDGEGHITLPRAKTALKLGLSQRQGPIQDQIERTLTALGYRFASYGEARESKVVHTEIQGGLSAILRLLGSIRSERLIAKWMNGDAADSTTQAAPIEVVAVEPAGQREIQRLATSTGTYIGEGFLMHNSDGHLARDGSPRKTYRKAKALITGDVEAKLHPNNMGGYGYRGTKRPEDGGRSARREAYWRLAQESVRHWTTAELVLVNVSDFIAKHEIVEPLVDDWCELLSVYGWTNQVRHEVVTPRMRHGQNADKRVAAEVIIEATRG